MSKRNLVFVFSLALFAGACGGDGLPRTALGEGSNVALSDTHAYVAVGDGFLILNLEEAALRAQAQSLREDLRVFNLATLTAPDLSLPPPEGLKTVDDVAVVDDFLFLLDARGSGRLAMLSIASPTSPVLLGTPVSVRVGPFSGVSAGGGRVVVSGGTGSLTLRSYDGTGLGELVSRDDLGRGQPDILISPDGLRAFASTDFGGSRFGITVLSLAVPPIDPTTLARVRISDAGFSNGGASPASFPIQSALVGDTLLVAHGGGIEVLDVSETPAEESLSTLDIGLKGVAIAVHGTKAYVVGSDPAPSLVVLDISDPRSPSVIETHPLAEESYPTGVAANALGVIIAGHQIPVIQEEL